MTAVRRWQEEAPSRLKQEDWRAAPAHLARGRTPTLLSVADGELSLAARLLHFGQPL